MTRAEERHLLSQNGYSHQEITRHYKRADALSMLYNGNFSPELIHLFEFVIRDIFRVNLDKQLEIIKGEKT